MKLVHWPLIDGLLHLVQRVSGTLAVPNVTAHPSTASKGTPKLAQIFAYGKWLYPCRMLLHGASDLDQ